MDGIEYNRRDGFAASSSDKDFALSPDLLQQNDQQQDLVSSSGWLSNIPKKIQEPSQKQWKDIRRVLQRLYIDEGRSLENVIRFLRCQQRMKVTKKQLTTKLKLWGMRKNTKLNERVMIVQSCNGAEQNFSLDALGPKVSRAKLERWHKEMKNVMICKSTIRHSDGRNLKPCPTIPAPHSYKQHQDVQSTLEETGEYISDPDQVMSVEDVGERHKNSSRDSWPFSSVAVEIIGSPKLSRLFAALKIECPEEITTFWLDKTYKSPSGQVESYCFSEIGLEQLSQPSEVGSPPDGGQSLGSTVSRSAAAYSPTSERNANPLKYPHLDFLLSQSEYAMPISPSPFNELYVFPAKYTHRFDTNLPANMLSASQLNDLLSWDDTNYGDSLCYEQHSDIICAMDEQAWNFYNEGNYAEAERWFRKVLSARRRAEGTGSTETLSTALDIIEVVQESGNILVARKWHTEIHGTILSNFPPTNSLVLKSLRIRAYNFSLATDYEEEENIFREALQAVLVSSGPRHIDTQQELLHLSGAMLDQCKLTEAEQLVLIMLQICKTEPDSHFNVVDSAMSNLVSVLLLKRETQSALEWSIRRAERAEANLGEDHLAAMNARGRVARCLRATGRIEESEELYDKTLRSMIRVLGERHEETIHFICDYGCMLSEDGKYSEAETWLSTTFELSLGSLGPEHKHSLISCDWLVWNLQKMSKFDEALQLCERYLRELSLRDGITDQHKLIIKVQGWIDKVGKRIDEQMRDFDIFEVEEQ